MFRKEFAAPRRHYVVESQAVQGDSRIKDQRLFWCLKMIPPMYANLFSQNLV